MSLVVPRLPSSLSSLEHCWTGPALRAQLLGRRPRTPWVLWVRAERDTLCERWPELRPYSDDHLQGPDGLLVRALSTSVMEALEACALSVEAFGLGGDGVLYDPAGASAAVSEITLRPGVTVRSDPGVLVRAAGLVAETGAPLAAETLERLREDAGLVLKTHRAVLRDELSALLLGQEASLGLQALADIGSLRFVLPEVASLIELHKSSRHHHKDVWRHTRQVVRQSVPVLAVRWAALLHDIGKVHTRSYDGNKVHFLRHDDLGAYQIEGIASRLQFPLELAERVRLLVSYHLRANLYDGSWTDSAVRRFDLEIGPVYEDLMRLSRADVTSQRPGRRREALANLHALDVRVKALRRLALTTEAEPPAVPKGLGRAIIDVLKIQPGPRVGELRRACEAAVARGELPSNAEIGVYLAYLTLALERAAE